MVLKDFVFTFFRSLNPDAYRHIVHKRMHEGFSYFLFLVFFSVLLSSVIFFITAPKIADYVDTQFSKFDIFNISMDVKLKEPVTVLKSPLVVIDTSNNRTGLRGENVLVTDSAIYIKKFSPDLFNFRPTLYKVEEKDITQFSDILANRDFFREIIVTLFFLALPSIIFIVFLLFALRYLFIIAVAVIVYLIFTKVFRRQVHVPAVINTGFFAATPMVFLGVVVSPYFNLGVIPLIIFIVFFIVGIMMTSERELRLKKKVFEPPKEDEDGIL